MWAKTTQPHEKCYLHAFNNSTMMQDSHRTDRGDEKVSGSHQQRSTPFASFLACRRRQHSGPTEQQLLLRYRCPLSGEQSSIPDTSDGARWVRKGLSSEAALKNRHETKPANRSS